MSSLRSRRDALLASGRSLLSPNTLRSYDNAWSTFRRWCAAAGRPSLPATGETLELYVTWLLLDLERRISTAESHCAAVFHAHRQAAQPVPEFSGARGVLAATRRARREQPRGKRALDPRDLIAFAKACDARTVVGCRDRAIVVVGFASGMRRSELAGLSAADVSFRGGGVVLHIRSSKTDQLGAGRVLGVWPGKRACTDPVRVLKAWLRVRGSWEGPLFCRVQTGGLLMDERLHGDAISAIVKRMAKALGRNPAEYGAHSLRAGVATTAARLGRSDQEIMAVTGHKSAAVMRTYVRESRLFAGRNPLAGVL